MLVSIGTKAVSVEAVALALDLGTAKWGISRDLEELVHGGPIGVAILVLCVALPALSLVALLFKRWLALIPLALSVALFALWALYYATDWWSNPGQGAWMPAVALVLLGWLVLLVAALPRTRWIDEL